MIIGITGGIGSGKSTIARELASRGYRLYDTDREAKRLIVSDPELRKQIEDLLGSDVYEGNVYRTDIVSARVFNNPDLLARLNAIVHPAVRHDIENLLNSKLSTEGCNLIIESALLFESGLAIMCDKVICVIAPESICIARTIARDHTTEEQVRARIANQMSDSERCSRADIVLVNDGKMTISALVNSLFI